MAEFGVVKWVMAKTRLPLKTVKRFTKKEAARLDALQVAAEAAHELGEDARGHPSDHEGYDPPVNSYPDGNCTVQVACRRCGAKHDWTFDPDLESTATVIAKGPLCDGCRYLAHTTGNKWEEHSWED